MIFQLDFQSTSPIYRQLRDRGGACHRSGAADPGRAAAHHPRPGGGCGRQRNDREQSVPAAQIRGVSCHRPAQRRRGMRPAGQGADPEQAAQLRLLAGEARCAGLSQEAFLDACRKAYGERRDKG